MFGSIHHVGLVVCDLNKVLYFYSEILGYRYELKEDIPGLKIAFVYTDGTFLEIIQPDGLESPLAKYLKAKGEGVNHIAVKVKDIEACLNQLKKQKITLIDEKTRRGASGQVAFTAPKNSGGVLIQLVEEK